MIITKLSNFVKDRLIENLDVFQIEGNRFQLMIDLHTTYIFWREGGRMQGMVYRNGVKCRIDDYVIEAAILS